jgi:hypothetical protein
MRSLIAIGAVACSLLFLETSAEIASVADAPVLKKFSELPLDENGHLADHWLLFTNSRQCKEDTQAAWIQAAPELRKVAAADGELKKAFFGSSTSKCSAVILERGTAGNLISHPLPENFHDVKDVKSYSDWIHQMQRVEIGFINYEAHEANIYWIQPGSNKRVHVGNLGIGERQTVWQQTFLGHRFEVISKVNNEIYGRFTAEHHAFLPMGQRASMTRPMEVDNQVG